MAKINEQVSRVLAAIGATPEKLGDKRVLENAIAYVQGTPGLSHKNATKRRLRALATAAKSGKLVAA